MIKLSVFPFKKLLTTLLLYSVLASDRTNRERRMRKFQATEFKLMMKISLQNQKKYKGGYPDRVLWVFWPCKLSCNINSYRFVLWRGEIRQCHLQITRMTSMFSAFSILMMSSMVVKIMPMCLTNHQQDTQNNCVNYSALHDELGRFFWTFFPFSRSYATSRFPLHLMLIVMHHGKGFVRII